MLKLKKFVQPLFVVCMLLSLVDITIVLDPNLAITWGDDD